MNKTFEFNTFSNPVDLLPTLKITIDTSINKKFTINRLNKGVAPKDLIIKWGDGTITKYDDLLDDSNLLNGYSHEYTTTNVFDIIMHGSVTENDIHTITFNGNTNILALDGTLFFYCNAVRDNQSDTNHPLITRNWIFGNTTNLKSISENLFSLCTNIQNLTSCFQKSGLVNIPENLLHYNTKITDLTSLFNQCSLLTTIPENIFKNVIKLSNCYCLFYISGLVNIPEGLFKYNPLITDITSIFNQTQIVTVPINLFNQNSLLKIVDYSFYNCTKLTSTVPDLWNTSKWSKITSKTGCFSGCTKAANYVSIPSGWK